MKKKIRNVDDDDEVEIKEHKVKNKKVYKKKRKNQ